MKIRSFIAVDPSPEVLGRIDDFIRRLSKETKNIRWVEPGGVHLTLRFLGEVEESTLEEVRGRLAKRFENQTPTELRAKGVGFFPSTQRPRVVWVGLEGEVDRLAALQAQVTEAVRDLPVHPEEDRAFTPHLTVARIKDFRIVSGVAKILRAAPEADFGEFVVSSVILYKSSLTPKGAEYTKLEEFKF